MKRLAGAGGGRAGGGGRRARYQIGGAHQKSSSAKVVRKVLSVSLPPVFVGSTFVAMIGWTVKPSAVADQIWPAAVPTSVVDFVMERVS